MVDLTLKAGDLVFFRNQIEPGSFLKDAGQKLQLGRYYHVKMICSDFTIANIDSHADPRQRIELIFDMMSGNALSVWATGINIDNVILAPQTIGPIDGFGVVDVLRRKPSITEGTSTLGSEAAACGYLLRGVTKVNEDIGRYNNKPIYYAQVHKVMNKSLDFLATAGPSKLAPFFHGISILKNLHYLPRVRQLHEDKAELLHSFLREGKVSGSAKGMACSTFVTFCYQAALALRNESGFPDHSRVSSLPFNLTPHELFDALVASHEFDVVYSNMSGRWSPYCRQVVPGSSATVDMSLLNFFNHTAEGIQNYFYANRSLRDVGKVFISQMTYN